MIAAAHFKEDPNYYHKLLAAGLSWKWLIY
jgi:hypothetical protein